MNYTNNFPNIKSPKYLYAFFSVFLWNSIPSIPLSDDSSDDNVID